MADDPLFRPGDWVQVWARVEETSHPHPEDLRISVDSHNASPNAVFDIRRDWVIPTDRLPPFAQTCTAMVQSVAGYWWRCELHESHAGDEHIANSKAVRWTNADVNGYIEEA